MVLTLVFIQEFICFQGFNFHNSLAEASPRWEEAEEADKELANPISIIAEGRHGFASNYGVEFGGFARLCFFFFHNI